MASPADAPADEPAPANPAHAEVEREARRIAEVDINKSCLWVIGLSDHASWRQVQKAYINKAYQLHPLKGGRGCANAAAAWPCAFELPVISSRTSGPIAPASKRAPVCSK